MNLLTMLVVLTWTSLINLNPATQYVTVGPAEFGQCDYQSIEEFLVDTEGIFSIYEIRLMNTVYQERLELIETGKKFHFIGGFNSCLDATKNFKPKGESSITTIDAMNLGPVIVHKPSLGLQQLTIENITLINGLSVSEVHPGGGIVLLQSSILNLRNSFVLNNEGSSGGGIYGDTNTKINIYNSKLDANKALSGGGIFCNGCVLEIDQYSQITNNVATNNGGGIYGLSSDISICSSTNYVFGCEYDPLWKTPISADQPNNISDNQAVSLGGGIYLASSSLNVNAHQVTFSFKNNTSSTGGAIYADDSTLGFRNTRFISNLANTSGGAIELINGSELDIGLNTNSESYSSCRQTCNQFINNSVTDNVGLGGAISVRNNSELDIKQTWFEKNKAGINSGLGSAILMISNPVLSKIENTVFFDNGAVGLNGGLMPDHSVIASLSSNLEMTHVTMVDNPISEGMLYIDGNNHGLPVLYQTTLTNGIFHHEDATPVMIRVNNPLVDVNCTMVHEDSSLPVSADAIIGTPSFINRNTGALELNANAGLLIDQCSNHSIGPDLSNRERGVDLIPFNNDKSDYYDMGAFEYPGFNTDVIFQSGFN